MKELGPATENDIVLAFVQAEIDSARYGELYSGTLLNSGLDRQSLVDAPNLRSARDNLVRRDLLRAIRGYPSGTLLFTGFPTNVLWRRTTIMPDEFRILKYAKYPSWEALSGGSRLVVDGARNVAVQIVVRGPDANSIAQIEREIADGKRNITAVANEIKNGKRYPPLIAVEDEGGFLILIEGHTRATAYALAQVNEPIEILVGSSPDMMNWVFY